MSSMLSGLHIARSLQTERHATKSPATRRSALVPVTICAILTGVLGIGSIVLLVLAEALMSQRLLTFGAATGVSCLLFSLGLLTLQCGREHESERKGHERDAAARE